MNTPEQTFLDLHIKRVSNTPVSKNEFKLREIEEWRMADLDEINPILLQGADLFTENGIDASSKDGPFGRPFCRDTYFSTLAFLYGTNDFNTTLNNSINGKALLNASLSYLKNMNEDGLLAHEVSIRKKDKNGNEVDNNDGFPTHWEDTIRTINNKDNTVEYRRYTSIDGNGLAMLTLDKLLELEGSGKLDEIPEDKKRVMLEAMGKMTKWAINNVNNHQGLIGYDDPDHDETWQDGSDSLLDENYRKPKRPLATSLEQALYFEVLNRMADRFADSDSTLSSEARKAAAFLKKNFNEKFVYYDDRKQHYCIARAVGADGKQIRFTNIDSLIALGFTYNNETILDKTNEEKITSIVSGLYNELITPFGLRNQGLDTPVIQGNGYHGPNSLWPFANGLAARALDKVLAPLMADKGNNSAQHVFHNYALTLSDATMRTLLYLQSPVETAHIKDNDIALYKEFQKLNNKQFESCRIQAWTVAWGYWMYNFLKTNNIDRILVPPPMNPLPEYNQASLMQTAVDIPVNYST